MPLVVAYLAILYAYAAKILIQWELPKGQIGYLVSGYASFGVATHLLAHPLRDTGGRLVRQFHRYFYRALVVPIALLAVGTGVRVGDYGVTEGRYALTLFAVWLVGIALYHALPIRRRLLTAPLSLSLLLAAASFGPWGASAVSTRSQLGQLETLLAANGLLVDGTIVPADQAIDQQDTKRISSITDYLMRLEGRGAFRAWAADGGLDLNDEIHRRAVLAAFGLDHISEWRDVAIFRHWSGRWAVLDVADFAIVGWVTLAPARSQGLAGEGSDRAYTIVLDAAGRAVTVTGTGDEAVEVDLTDLFARLNRHDAENPWPVPAVEMTLEGSNGTLRARLQFESLSGTIDSGVPKVTEAVVTVLIGRPEAAR